jgi:hypothetical protein
MVREVVWTLEAISTLLAGRVPFRGQLARLVVGLDHLFNLLRRRWRGGLIIVNRFCRPFRTFGLVLREDLDRGPAIVIVCTEVGIKVAREKCLGGVLDIHLRHDPHSVVQQWLASS